jgi:signal peptidase I
MQIARRVTTVVVRAGLIAAIGLTLFVAYGLIDNAWYRVLAVRGGSMEPTIAAGDLIVITRPPERIETGQILTLQVDGAVVTHRVVETAADGTFATKGDANEGRDDWSANDVHVVGEYRFSLPFIGTVIDVISGAWLGDATSVGAATGAGAWDTGLAVVSTDRQVGELTPETVTPSPPSSPTPSPSAPAPTPSGTPSPEGTPIPSPTVDVDPTASATPDAPAPATTPDATPAASNDPPDTASPVPTPTPDPSAAAETPIATATPTPTPSASP